MASPLRRCHSNLHLMNTDNAILVAFWANKFECNCLDKKPSILAPPWSMNPESKYQTNYVSY